MLDQGGQQFVDSLWRSYYEDVGCAAKGMHRITFRTQRECKFYLFTSYKFRSDCFWFNRRVLCIMGFKMQGWPLPRVYHAASMSITSVLYLKDEVSIATAGSVDSIVKFWDTRKLKAQVTQTCPHPESDEAPKGRFHCITSLSQDQSGLFLSASCSDNRIYLYNVLRVDKGPISSFSANKIGSFFVKAVISPDASHILSGSSDGNAYMWQVDRPNAEPVVLESHDGEVTSVDWCQHDSEKFATCSDDLTVRFWSMGSRCLPPPRSITRRRVMALPSCGMYRG